MFEVCLSLKINNFTHVTTFISVKHIQCILYTNECQPRRTKEISMMKAFNFSIFPFHCKVLDIGYFSRLYSSKWFRQQRKLVFLLLEWLRNCTRLEWFFYLVHPISICILFAHNQQRMLRP